jgi:hypothetical protein
VFHGRVYADLMTNPLIVPVKILKGHKVRACCAWCVCVCCVRVCLLCVCRV